MERSIRTGNKVLLEVVAGFRPPLRLGGVGDRGAWRISAHFDEVGEAKLPTLWTAAGTEGSSSAAIKSSARLAQRASMVASFQLALHQVTAEPAAPARATPSILPPPAASAWRFEPPTRPARVPRPKACATPGVASDKEGSGGF
jgi:hypothetical protein